MRDQSWTAIRALALILVLGHAPLVSTAEPLETGPSQRAVLFDSAVRQQSQALADKAAAGMPVTRQIDALEQSATAASLSPAQRDAVFYEYIRHLRQGPPGSVPTAVIDWLRAYPPQAVTRHPESASYLVALFDVAGAASGLANQWQFQSAADALTGTGLTELPAILKAYQSKPTDPWSNGVRWALPKLPDKRLDWLAQSLDVDQTDPHLLAHIHLARHSAEELLDLLPGLDASQTTSFLQAAARLWPAERQLVLMEQVLEQSDSGVVALAMARITDLVSSDDQAMLGWGRRLISKLDDEILGANAALQLARMPEVNWLEHLGGEHELSPRARQRLELIAELEPQVQRIDQGGLR